MTTTILDLASVDAEMTDLLVELSWHSARRHAPRWLPTRDDAREQGTIARVLVVGTIPDAEGLGRPSIQMSKRVGPTP